MKKALTIAKNIFLTGTPIYVIFFVTSLCNAKCKMCFNWENVDAADPSQELSLREIKKTFSSFSTIQHLTLSGGEPFLRRDLHEILKYVSLINNVQTITIPTNGLLPNKIHSITKEILGNVQKYTHIRVSLSIEGIGRDHDDIIQVPGAFERIKETYHLLSTIRESNFNIDLNLCLNGFNKDHFKKTLKYCHDFFTSSSIEVTLARGTPREKMSKDISVDVYKNVLNYIHQMKNAKKCNKPFSHLLDAIESIAYNQIATIMETGLMPSRCYSGSKLIVLQSNGDVFPCEHLGHTLGNLRDVGYNIQEIISSNLAKRAAESIINGKCCCTWECALINNQVCNPLTYPRIIREMIKGKRGISPN